MIGGRNFRPKQWLWVAYPVLAVMFVVMSAVMLFSNPERWTELVEKKGRLQKQDARVAFLQEKLRVLEAMDLEKGEDDLRLLLRVVPPSKQVATLISQMKAAATESGIVLSSYRGAGGKVGEASASATVGGDKDRLVMEAVFGVGNLENLRMLLERLERKLPVMRVVKIAYTGEVVSLEVEGAWAPWKKEAGHEAPLPDFGKSLSQAKRVIEGLEMPSGEVEEPSSDSGEIVSNPF